MKKVFLAVISAAVIKRDKSQRSNKYYQLRLTQSDGAD